MHILFHGSYRIVRQSAGLSSPAEFTTALCTVTGSAGSVILPAFSYCFKRKNGNEKKYSRTFTPAETGAFCEEFRRNKRTVRTLSPTHSFSMQGAVCNDISEENNPVSPLGAGSVPEWLARQEQGYILLAGCGFESMSFLHYLEAYYTVPYLSHSPWGGLGILPEGCGEGAQLLTQIPGCSKAFNSFYRYLISRHGLMPADVNGCSVQLLNAGWMTEAAPEFFKFRYRELLCPAGDCLPCGSRHNYLNLIEESEGNVQYKS